MPLDRLLKDLTKQKVNSKLSELHKIFQFDPHRESTYTVEKLS